MIDDVDDIKPDRVHPLPPSTVKQDKETTLWQKIIGPFLPKAAHPLKDYADRFQALHEDATEIRTDLQTMKTQLEGQVDHDLFILVQEVIDPLLREVDKIQKHTMPSPEILRRYSEWTSKASLWVHLYTKAGDVEKITHCIVEHIEEKAVDLINRDIKMILDDIDHSGVDKGKLLEVVAPFIEQLDALKVQKEKVDLTQINAWKNQLDTMRAKIVNEALHAIDSF